MADIGRPSKYDPAFCEKVVECGRQGMGRAEIASELDITRNTLAAWESEHPEFLSATTRASEHSAAWWARKGRLGIDDRNFNANAYSLQVRNRFPGEWRDKQQVEHSGVDGKPIELTAVPTEELCAKAAALAGRVVGQIPSQTGTDG